MNSKNFLLLAGSLAAGLTIPVFCATHTSSAEKPSKAAGRTALEAVAKQWDPTHGARDYHSVGGFLPTNAPPTVYALSFSSSQSLSQVWEFFAGQCGMNKKYSETSYQTLTGKTERGSYLLLERFNEQRRCESIFAFQTKDKTITATVHPSNGDRTTAGTVTIVQH